MLGATGQAGGEEALDGAGLVAVLERHEILHHCQRAGRIAGQQVGAATVVERAMAHLPRRLRRRGFHEHGRRVDQLMRLAQLALGHPRQIGGDLPGLTDDLFAR